MKVAVNRSAQTKAPFASRTRAKTVGPAIRSQTPRTNATATLDSRVRTASSQTRGAPPECSARDAAAV